MGNEDRTSGLVVLIRSVVSGDNSMYGQEVLVISGNCVLLQGETSRFHKLGNAHARVRVRRSKNVRVESVGRRWWGGDRCKMTTQSKQQKRQMDSKKHDAKKDVCLED